MRDNRHDSVNLLGAICPARGIGAAIIMPAVNNGAMNEHLQEFSAQVGVGAIALLHLPRYAPELNPMKNVWAYLRSNKLCNLVWDAYDDIVQARAEAWKLLTDSPERKQSIGARKWASVSG